MRITQNRLAVVAALCVWMAVTGFAWLGGPAGGFEIGAGVYHAATQEKPDPKRIKNPVPSDEKSIAEGRKVYARTCVGCHGPSGKGDGGMAVGGSTPADLTDAEWQHKTSDGEIFVVIRDGLSSDMDSYKDRLTETQMWQLINYIRTLRTKEQ